MRNHVHFRASNLNFLSFALYDICAIPQGTLVLGWEFSVALKSCLDGLPASPRHIKAWLHSMRDGIICFVAHGVGMGRSCFFRHVVGRFLKQPPFPFSPGPGVLQVTCFVGPLHRAPCPSTSATCMAQPSQCVQAGPVEPAGQCWISRGWQHPEAMPMPGRKVKDLGWRKGRWSWQCS